jgi:hypothetical protein
MFYSQTYYATIKSDRTSYTLLVLCHGISKHFRILVRCIHCDRFQKL